MAYVYRHIRDDKNEPFYIGIGSDDNGDYKRAYSKSRRASRLWNFIVAKTTYHVEILMDGIDWDFACLKEKEFIKLYGRINLGTGTLSNLTDGGEGNIGLVTTPEMRYKFGNANRGKKMSPESSVKKSIKLKGKSRSEETRRKISLSKRGVKLSEERKAHLSQINKGKKLSAETIEKIKKTKSQRTYVYVGRKKSDDEKRKIANAHRGKQYCLGYKHSPQSCMNMKMASTQKKSVCQYSLSGELISEHFSQREAQFKTGIAKESIGRACKSKSGFCKGFIWRYKQ